MGITGLTFINQATGVRTIVRLRNTRRSLKCLHRRVRTDPFYDEDGVHAGWHTKPADWYLAWFEGDGRGGGSYYYDGLEKERGFKTRKEAEARRRKILAQAEKA